MLDGCITAVVTPFRDGAVDLHAVDRLIDRQVQGGVAGVIVCGTTGESPTLTGEEQTRLLERVIARVRGALPVWMGTGSFSTRDAIAKTRAACAAGADGVLVVSPYYNRPGPGGLREHFLAVADASTVPLMLYDIPSRTGCLIGPELCAELCDHERIVAVKDATGSMANAFGLVQSGVPVLSGDDANTLPLMSVGARGVVSVASNLVPAEISALVEQVAQGDHAGARERHYRLLPLMQALFLESNPAPAKALLAELGWCTAEVRLPLVESGVGTLSRLRDAFSAAMGEGGLAEAAAS